MKIENGPFKDALDSDNVGVILREIITYRKKGDMLVREVVTRNYRVGGDYHDTTTITPITYNLMTGVV